VTLSASAFLFNYAAPELFAMQSEGDVHHEDRNAQKGGKSTKTDVYAFGCLYYAVRFTYFNLSGMLRAICADILQYRSFSGQIRISDHATRHKRRTSTSTRQPENGKQYMAYYPELLEKQSLCTSDS